MFVDVRYTIKPLNNICTKKVNLPCLLLGLWLFTMPFPIWVNAQIADTDTPHHKTEIKIAILANRGTEISLKEWEPTAEYLSERIPNYTFRIVPFTFEDFFDGVTSPENNISYFSANPSFYTYLEYHGKARRLVTMQMPGNPEPQSMFGGVIFTSASRTDISEIADLEDMHFAAVDSLSLGGWHAAWRELIEAGFNPKNDFASITFLGSHDNVVHAVLNGDVDAGTVRSTQLERMANENIIQLSEIKVIHSQHAIFPNYPALLSTRLYPEWPFAATDSAYDELSKKITIALLEMPSNHIAARSLQSVGWTVPEMYDEIHYLLRILALPPYDNDGITLTSTIQKYWQWLLLILLLFIVALGFGTIAVSLNMRTQKMADDLVKSEEQFRVLVTNSSDLIWLLKPNGVFSYASLSWKPVFGYEPEDVINKPVSNFVHREDLPICLSYIKQVVQAKTTIQGPQYRVIHGDGSLRWHEATMTPVYNQESVIQYYVGISRDITEKKNIEKTLQENQKKLQHAHLLMNYVVENSNSAIAIFDNNLNFIYVSKRFQEEYDVKDQEIIGRHHYEVFPNLPQKWKGVHKRALMGEILKEDEDEYITKDGKTEWTRWECRPWYTEEQEIGGIIVYTELITKRKESEIELRKLSTAVIQSPASIVITDTTGVIEYVNPKFEELTGYTAEEAIGNKPSILKSGTQSLSFYNEMWNTISNGNVWRGELHNKKKDGSLYWEDATISPVFNENGKITNYLAVKEDITQRKIAESKIKESAEKYRIVSENTYHWEFWEREDGTFIYNSPSCERITGYTVQEFEENPELMINILHEEDKEHFILHRKKTWSDYEPDECSFRIYTKNGELRYIDHVCQPAYNSAGVFIGIRGTNIDVTDKKAIERDLVESEKRFRQSDLYHRSLLQTNPDLVFVFSKDGIFLDYHSSDDDDLSLPPKEFLNKNVKDIMPEEISMKILQAIERCILEKVLVSFEYDLHIKDELRHYSAKSVAFGKKKVLITIRDITEYQNNLIEIKSLLQLKDEQTERLRNFTHIVSHNLRSHTANMQGILNLLEVEEPDLFENDYIKMMLTTASNLEETIRNLNEVLDLTLKPIEVKTQVNLSEIAQEVVSSVSTFARESGVRIFNEINTPLIIDTVPEYMKSIFLNLITNGIKFRSTDKKPFIKISASKQDNFLVLQVEDNGLGIDMDRHHEKMFRMYKTFHDKSDSKGLGLFMTKNKVEAMGGRIDVSSKVNEGTCFKVYLPLG